MSTLAINKRANYDYEILENYEAGLVLTGQEVKAVRAGQIKPGNEYNINSINFTQQRFGLTEHGIPAQQKALDVVERQFQINKNNLNNK